MKRYEVSIFYTTTTATGPSCYFDSYEVQADCYEDVLHECENDEKELAEEGYKVISHNIRMA